MSLDSLSKRLKRLSSALSIEDEIPDHILGAELMARAWGTIAAKLAIFQDASLSEEERAAACKRIDEEERRRKSPERLEQERRFYRKFDAAAAKDELLRRLENRAQ